MVWAGVDVGGRAKGFHAAVIDERRVLDVLRRPDRLAGAADVVAWLDRWRPGLVAVDSPLSLAEDDGRRRRDERRLARQVCAIRYTPTLEGLERQRRGASPRYYEWIECGLELYDALARAGFRAIECFPTASWTRWGGARGTTPRSAWSARALRASGLVGVPAGLGQDGRDAIGAALTARAHEMGSTEAFGAIVVPRRLDEGARR